MSESNRNEESETNEGGISGLSFALGLGAGIAIGIVGTVIFAAYSEENFGHVVRKTRSVGDKAQETANSIKDRVSDKFGDVAESTKRQIKRISGKIEEQLEKDPNAIAG